MNRKNTILVAVLINAGLVAVLLAVALMTQEDLPTPNAIAKQDSVSLPAFEEVPLYQEVPVLAVADPAKSADSPPFSEPVVHKLPPLAPEPFSSPAAPQLPVKPDPVAPIASAPGNVISVKKGDSLEKIAKAYHTTVDEIIKLNHLPSSFLKVGQSLKIPAERSVSKIPEKAVKALDPTPEYYTIKVGENPWAIAMKHHMKLEELLKLNGLNEEKARKLKPGDRLRIK